jgi:hypothetical protein
MPLRRREPEAAHSALGSAALITTCRVLHLGLSGQPSDGALDNDP